MCELPLVLFVFVFLSLSWTRLRLTPGAASWRAFDVEFEKAPPQNSSAAIGSRAPCVAAGRSGENFAHAVEAGAYGPTFGDAACALSAQHVVLQSACTVSM